MMTGTRAAAEAGRPPQVVGWESSAFLPGMVDGRTTFDRLKTLGSIPRLLTSTMRHGSFNRRLDEHLEAVVSVARGVFDGPLTYAAGMWEQVDWNRFQIVGVDAYRDARNAPGMPWEPKEAFHRLSALYAGHAREQA